MCGSHPWCGACGAGFPRGIPTRTCSRGGSHSGSGSSCREQEGNGGSRESYGRDDPAIETTGEAFFFKGRPTSAGELEPRFTAFVQIVRATTADEIPVMSGRRTLTHVAQRGEDSFPGPGPSPGNRNHFRK